MAVTKHRGLFAVLKVMYHVRVRVRQARACCARASAPSRGLCRQPGSLPILGHRTCRLVSASDAPGDRGRSSRRIVVQGGPRICPVGRPELKSLEVDGVSRRELDRIVDIRRP